MFFNPYYYMPNRSCSYGKKMVSCVRVFHASPDAPAVDVYANDKLIAKNLSYKEFSKYLQIKPGKYNIKVYPTGETQNPVINTNVTAPPCSIFTVAAVDCLCDIELLPIPEPGKPIPPGKTCVRFVHLSPNAPNVDITLPDGAILFENVGFKEYTDYIIVDPGTYTLQVRPTGTDEVVLTVPNVKVNPCRFYTVYAVGIAGACKNPLEAVLSLDGNCYLKV